MKKGVCYLSLLLGLASCQTPTAREISEFVGRPDFGNPCIVNDDGTCYENGELREATNMLATDPEKFDEIQTYIEEIEFRLYKCIKFKKRCK